MNNPKQILWTDTNSMPPHNYLWQREDGIYVFVNGDGKKSKAFDDSGEDGSGSGSGGNDAPSTQDFKFIYPNNIVGFVDNTNWNGWVLDYSTNTLTLLKPIIKLDELNNYVKNLIDEDPEHSVNLILTVVTEWDETLGNNNNYLTEYSYYGYLYNGVYGYSCGSAYVGFPKAYEDETGKYIVYLPAGD